MEDELRVEGAQFPVVCVGYRFVGCTAGGEARRGDTAGA